MIKAIIFDCFGVVLSDNFDEAYTRFGGDVQKDRDFIRQVFNDSHTGKTERSSLVFAKHLGISVDQWQITTDESRMLNQELLNDIKILKHTYKIGMLSNIGRRGVRWYLPEDILKEHFDVVVESSAIGFAKPDARAYEITAERLGVLPEECLFVDDRENYVEGAQHVGMKTILYIDYASYKMQLSLLS